MVLESTGEGMMHIHKFGAAISLGLAVALAVPASAQTAPSAARSVTAAHQAQCDRLAAALTPENALLGQMDVLIDNLITAMTREDDTMREMEAEFPGILDAIAQAMKPVLIKSAQETMPLYRADLAKLYCQNLTAAEARQAADFFLSADGVAMTTALNRNLNYKRTTATMAQETEATTRDVQADKRAAAQRAESELTEAQNRRITAFFNSPVGRKLIAMGPQKNAIDLKWFNYSSPESDQAMGIAVATAMVDHIAKTDPATADKFRGYFEAQGVLPKR